MPVNYSTGEITLRQRVQDNDESFVSLRDVLLECSNDNQRQAQCLQLACSP